MAPDSGWILDLDEFWNANFSLFLQLTETFLIPRGYIDLWLEFGLIVVALVWKLISVTQPFQQLWDVDFLT